jgi:hypothetical protein
MPLQLKYRHAQDRSRMRFVPASLALFASCGFFLVPISAAQSHTTTSSSGGHASTSAHATHSTSWISSSSPARTAPSSGPSRNGEPNHHSRGYWRGGVYYPYAVPVGGAVDSNSATANGDAECQGGPTIFDRCSSTPGNYIPPTSEGPAHGSMMQSGIANASYSAPEATSPTTLVFKDGHELEVDNYAVAGQTLYDLTPGRSQKIALSDLDLSATQKQNHDQGAAFELPPTHAN